MMDRPSALCSEQSLSRQGCSEQSRPTQIASSSADLQTTSIILYTISAAIIYLLLDALIGGWLDNIPFMESLLSSSDHQEWWMRTITITIICIFGWYSYRTLLHQTQLSTAATLAKESLQLLLNTAAEGIIYLTPTRKIKMANPASCQLTGYTEEQLKQGNLHRLLAPSLPADEDPVS
ncbi:MAG: PAS domain-containing protein, partial [Mariprofundales bacterium]|nr:PAS domain-containing protein [Mariprofundales bacterium]